jgi:hypothetical protein
MGDLFTTTQYVTIASPPPPLFTHVAFTDEKHPYTQEPIHSGDFVLAYIDDPNVDRPHRAYPHVQIWGFNDRMQPVPFGSQLHRDQYLAVGPYRLSVDRFV